MPERSPRECLVDEINQSGVPRKALAEEVANSDESLFSKMVSGARPFDIDHVGRLPRDLQVKWMQRYGDEIGVSVKDVDPAELNQELLSLVDRIVAVRRLADVVTKPAKAGLPAPQQAKRSA